jgi:hypothetical protein
VPSPAWLAARCCYGLAMSAAQHFLDQVQSLARIDALEADPAGYAERLASEVGDAATLEELDARDARLRHALGQLDAMIERATRIRLDHALAEDTSIAAPTRKVFATTIVGYAERLALLEARAREVAARGGAADPDGVATRVGEVARAVLGLREAIRAGVLALVRDLAAAAAPLADRRARDRTLDEPTRRRWSAARRDLEATASQPEHIASAPMATRLAAWPEQLDEPEPEREPTFADMIELD